MKNPPDNKTTPSPLKQEGAQIIRTYGQTQTSTSALIRCASSGQFVGKGSNYYKIRQAQQKKIVYKIK